jgi:glyoxylase-like metal-dependent hydrolase (beta-lactamase superfamily II)
MTSHTFNQLTARTYWLSPDGTTDRPALGVVCGAQHCLLIDAGNSPAHALALKQALAQHHLPAPTLALLTHWHWDHIFGTAEFEIPTFASRETARIVRQLAAWDWGDAALDARVAEGREIAFCRDMLRAELPDRSQLVIRPPDVAFDSRVTLDLGGLTCELLHVGGDHAHDASIAFMPHERVVFLGDCIYDDLHHGPRRLTTTLLFPLLDRLLALDADFYVASHHPEPMTRAVFEGEAKLLKTIGSLVVAHGQNRDAILAALPQRLNAPLNDDHRDTVNAFLAGLALPQVASIV